MKASRDSRATVVMISAARIKDFASTRQSVFAS